MKKAFMIVVALFVVLIVGCAKEGKGTLKTDNPEFEVTFLFEVDGMKVYRFTDGTRNVYICKKASVQYEGSELVGGRVTNLYRVESIIPE